MAVKGKDTKPTAWRWDLIWIVDFLAKVGVLAGGAFAIFQFLEAQKDAKIGRTMEYVRTYENGAAGAVGEARQAISATLRPYQPRFDELKQAGGVSRAAKDRIVMSLIETPENRALPDNVDRVVDFYEGLRVCVTTELCDRDVAIDYFSASEAPDLFDNFRPYIVSRRANNRTFGQGLEWFAQGRNAK